MIALELLTLLQAYGNVHEEADKNLHQAIWSLTKARRASRSFAVLPSTSTEISAASVRHDLMARTLVEFDKDIGVNSCFRSFDPASLSKQEHVAIYQDGTFGIDEGLRRRKGKTESSSKKEAMALDPLDTYNIASADEEALFIVGGTLPPRDLRIAQDLARKSLADYIQAATLVAALQRRMRATK